MFPLFGGNGIIGLRIGMTQREVSKQWFEVLHLGSGETRVERAENIQQSMMAIRHGLRVGEPKPEGDDGLSGGR